MPGAEHSVRRGVEPITLATTRSSRRRFPRLLRTTSVTNGDDRSETQRGRALPVWCLVAWVTGFHDAHPGTRAPVDEMN
jgi:hypothetical protein